MDGEKMCEELFRKFFEKHPIALEFGGEYIYRDYRAQMDALNLVCDICDLLSEQRDIKNKSVSILLEERLADDRENKEDEVIKQLGKIKAYCQNNPEGDDEFCSKCKYDVICCEAPDKWDMDKVKEMLKNE